MLGFGKKKPLTQEEFDVAADDVRRRMTEGDYVSGAQAAAALRKSVENRNGAGTLMWAEAHFLEARVALTRGDFPSGLEHMRAAAQIDGDDDESVRARLTNEMNLGDVLAELGEFAEAEEILRRSLEERRAFYGADHPGFGYGAESLGAVLLSQGRYQEAAELGRAAADAFRAGEPQKLHSSLALWLVASKAHDPEASALDLLDEGDVEEFLVAVATSAPSRMLDAVVDLRWEVYERLTDPEQKMSCLASIAQASRALDRHDDRISALEAFVDLSSEVSSDDGAYALQGLALALDEAGRPEDAEAAYERALELAELQRPQVLRNYALYLADEGADERAEDLFRQGLQEPSANEEDLARLAGAFGVFLHHRERFEEAARQLQRCIEGLPPSHPDRLAAAAHLQFAINGEPCNCAAGMPVALSQFVREVLEEYLPADLIGEVQVAEGFEISVHLMREPSEDEAEAIQLATTEARRRIRETTPP